MFEFLDHIDHLGHVLRQLVLLLHHLVDLLAADALVLLLQVDDDAGRAEAQENRDEIGQNNIHESLLKAFQVFHIDPVRGVDVPRRVSRRPRRTAAGDVRGVASPHADDQPGQVDDALLGAQHNIQHDLAVRIGPASEHAASRLGRGSPHTPRAE